MRIQPTNSSQVDSAASAQTKVLEAAAPAATSVASQANDSVDLSNVSALVRTAMDQPEVRTDKVEAIKAQIASGTYEIDPSKIADAIISELKK